MRLAASIVIAAMLAVGCVGAVPATPSPVPATAAPSNAVSSPVATATSTPFPTAAPTPTPDATSMPSTVALEPPEDLKRVAIVEQDGVRVRVELDRNPMPAGEVTKVTTVVRNLEDRPLHWLSDGCQIPVGVSGEATSGWPLGETHPPTPQLFKDLVLNRAFQQPPFQGPSIDFVPLRHLGTGSFGCADIGIVNTIEPHGSVRDVQAWDGNAALRFGPFPTGPVELHGSFGTYWRGKEMPETRTRLAYVLPAWVSGGPGTDWLGPVAVVDAALRDPGFLAWLDDTHITSGHAELLWYRPELAAWEVGAIDWYTAATPQVHVVLVDPHSGEVLRTVDRAWDERLDGAP